MKLKGEMITLYQRILKENQRLQRKIEDIQSLLSSYPQGKLICCHHQNHCKWYHSNGHQKTYIPKSNRILAEQLAAKKYLSAILSSLLHEKKALDFYLRHHANDSEQEKQFFQDNSGYQELLSPYFQPLSQELSKWMQEDYDRNRKYPEFLIHKTISGQFVRSKSEAMIASFLNHHQIPFRYECALSLDHMIFYPDFTIRHPVTGEFYYWEHFGKADDPSYIKNMCNKLQIYASNGIIPSVQLITTYETREHPLSTEIIEKTIEHYFL